MFNLKRPEFVVSDAFGFEQFSKQPDFALAQSLCTHLSEGDIKMCLGKLRAFTKPGAQFLATFFETSRPWTTR